jgi:7-cyano-7-deazaguanine reductase
VATLARTIPPCQRTRTGRVPNLSRVEPGAPGRRYHAGVPSPKPSPPGGALETFANPKPDRKYVIRFETGEFTCLCPKTGQPDFAVVRVEYVPDRLCVELKSWKLYLWSYRDQGAFHEAVTNRILDDLVACTRPHQARVECDFNVRGGIHTVVVAEHPAR